MRKIPTVFRRDPDNMKHVLPEVTPGCEWVLAGEGTATRKYDGTCCLLMGPTTESHGPTWWARREVKPGKERPEGFLVADQDYVTGKVVGWVPMETSSFARWHAEALATLKSFGKLVGQAVPHGTYELCGPKINGNPEGFEEHALVRHATAEQLEFDTYSFEHLRDAVLWYGDELGFEGVVWHHEDGRMAKLKARDFPREAIASAKTLREDER